MSMLTLAISCLTTSNSPWFMDLTLQHQILLLSPVTSTTGCCFCFGSISSFFLELFLHSSPVAYWASTYLGSSSFSVLIFCLFILFMGVSRQEYWSDLSFPLRESFPRQVDKKSRGPQGERGLEFSRRKKGQTFFPSLHSLGLYNNNVSCLRTASGLRTVSGLNLLILLS